jgi:hypothetical protein
MGDLKYPQWQKPLQELTLEFGCAKLPAKTKSVEILILERLERLKQERDGHEERAAIDDALLLF